MSTPDVGRQLKRQNFNCYGCFEKVTEENCIPTDHGILCPRCHDLVEDAGHNPVVFRRLMAFLEYTPAQKRIYLIGALKNPRIPEVGKKLREQGYDVFDEWFTPGPEADTNWQNYERLRGRTYSEALRGRAATNIFLFDRVYIELSDIVVLVMPVGKSAMIELGYSKGIGKKVIIFLDGKEPERYDVMPAFADLVVKTEEELVSVLGAQNS